MVEKFFWADALADKIIKERPNKNVYVCASGITPSGKVHIGNFREVITTEMVVRALRDKGKDVKFIYSWDDFDRFRKVPKGVNPEYEKYIGMPVSDVPSPYDSNKTYAEYFEDVFEESLKNLGIEPHFIYQHKMNKKCSYAELIKVSIDNKDKIVSILNKYRKEPLNKNWMPFVIYCDKCKKDLTKIIDVNGYEISYECECGFSETFDIRKKGIVSLRWRVDWPLRWKYEGVDFEPGGIDHSVFGGSFTTSKEISKEVFNHEPPIYQFYEWIGIKGGEEFASSSGNALSVEEVEEIYEPEILRYLFVGTKPKSKFQISFDNDVIKIYEDFDRLEEKYYNNTANPQEKRMYEMSNIYYNKGKPKRIGFRHLVTLVQLNRLKDLEESELIRAQKVKNWLEKYAQGDMKFIVQDKIEEVFDIKEKKALLELKNILEKRQFLNELELFSEFQDICKRIELDVSLFFQAAYRAIIRKNKGPKLAGLILLIGQERIINLLRTLEN